MNRSQVDHSLRRSGVANVRESLDNITINDDEEERREARRRTLITSSVSDCTSLTEENEALKNYLEMYNGNKLSRENAWSMSLIDTLSTLLDRHHKSLNNFKVASSSLEASSKVYSLRVDSVHTDVLRMSAGLNAQRYAEKSFLEDDDEDHAAPDEGSPDLNSTAKNAAVASKPKPKRQRRVVSTVTKNKESLNARLDTVPLQDPVFGKLNSTVGSINSSNRLMNNILLTNDSELLLRTNFPCWDSSDLGEIDYTAEVPLDDDASAGGGTVPCDMIMRLKNFDDLVVRPEFSGYVISDTPENVPDDDHTPPPDDSVPDFDDPMADQAMPMAFDMNAECEPLPLTSDQMPRYDEEIGHFDDMTADDRTALNNCRHLRRPAVVLDDLRPIDSTSKLEYSYRPLDKISQFWAGPAHWKFKRTRPRGSSMAGETVASRAAKSRSRRAQQMHLKKVSQKMKFDDFHDELFIRMDENYKPRNVNITKKWESSKLKLPTDLQLDATMFYKFTFAPGLDVNMNIDLCNSLMPNENDDRESLAGNSDSHFGDDGGSGGGNIMDGSSSWPENEVNTSILGDDGNAIALANDNEANQTVLEIPTHNEGAPTQIQKIIVPFAKRAKVIDMKNLKRSCSALLTKGLQQPFEEEKLRRHPIIRKEHYKSGAASFMEIYKHLPEVVSANMAESLSLTVAFYSLLHLANEHNLRLIPHEDLEDFTIRQIDDSADQLSVSTRSSMSVGGNTRVDDGSRLSLTP